MIQNPWNLNRPQAVLHCIDHGPAPRVYAEMLERFFEIRGVCCPALSLWWTPAREFGGEERACVEEEDKGRTRGARSDMLVFRAFPATWRRFLESKIATPPILNNVLDVFSHTDREDPRAAPHPTQAKALHIAPQPKPVNDHGSDGRGGAEKAAIGHNYVYALRAHIVPF
nr:hypothetical protein Iba_chr14aCG0490 [Ipomoea batatas]